MSGWAIVAIVAIVVWGIVQMAKAKAGIISDEDGNETFVGKSDDPNARVESDEMRREMKQLRERLQVLERIATDSNTMDARERARISAEIEALRGTEDSGDGFTASDTGVPLPSSPLASAPTTSSSDKKEQSQ